MEEVRKEDIAEQRELGERRREEWREDTLSIQRYVIRN
jgi:hypothetical protein